MGRGKRARRVPSPAWQRRDHELLVWTDLCDAARRMGFHVREESLPEEARLKGGVMRVVGQHFFVVDFGLSRSEKNRLLADLLRRCDTGGIYLPPYLRSWLEGGEDR